jgi:signal transduction histidine kinase
VRSQPDLAERAVQTISATGREALTELRRLLGVLRSEEAAGELTPQPAGTQSLSELAERVRAVGLPVRLEIVGDVDDLPAGVGLGVYRIVQEALTNSLKHAGPTRADVLLTYDEDAVEVEVIDAGLVNGFEPEVVDPDNPQHGLLGMRERVSLYGGEIVTGPCEDGRDGYRVWARIPLTST